LDLTNKHFVACSVETTLSALCPMRDSPRTACALYIQQLYVRGRIK